MAGGGRCFNNIYHLYVDTDAQARLYGMTYCRLPELFFNARDIFTDIYGYCYGIRYGYCYGIWYGTFVRNDILPYATSLFQCAWHIYRYSRILFPNEIRLIIAESMRLYLAAGLFVNRVHNTSIISTRLDHVCQGLLRFSTGISEEQPWNTRKTTGQPTYTLSPYTLGLQ